MMPSRQGGSHLETNRRHSLLGVSKRHIEEKNSWTRGFLMSNFLGLFSCCSSIIHVINIDYLSLICFSVPSGCFKTENNIWWVIISQMYFILHTSNRILLPRTPNCLTILSTFRTKGYYEASRSLNVPQNVYHMGPWLHSLSMCSAN